MQYKELYELGYEKLAKAGIEEAKLDARILLEFVCKTERTVLFAHPERIVDEIQQQAYLDGIEKRMQHIPLQHITGVQNFMGMDFLVNAHVLIPRQDTEILVEEVMKHLHDGMRILDVCTGSGCILLSLLRYSNDCEGVGLDLSSEALTVAKENAKNLALDQQASFVRSDLFKPLEDEAEKFFKQKFDIVVSNPPYIRTDVIDTLMPEVRDYEPRMALDGLADGLHFYRKIVEEAGKYLMRGGLLAFEIGYEQGEAVSNLLTDHGYHEIEVIKDYAGLDRVVLGTYYG